MHDKYRVPILDLDEKNLLDFAREALKAKGDEILYICDVGAATGRWTFYVREFLYEFPEKRFHLFEPTFGQFAELVNDYGDAPNVELNNFAVGETSRLGVFLDRPFAEHSSLDGHRPEPYERRRAVPVVSLDDYVAFTQLPHVSILKIDTEGAEPDVLRGFEHAILDGSVDCIQFEFGVGWTESLADVCQWLEDMDMQVFWFDGQSVVCFDPPANSQVADPTNLLAVKVREYE